MHDPHVFDPKHIEILESPDRENRQNTEEILELLELKPYFVVADLGCGSGYFTIPVARRVKKVYAIDVQKEMLDYLEQKIHSQKILNIETVLSKETTIPLPNESVDLVLSVNTLHEFRNKEDIINELYRILKPNGWVAIIDFKKEESDFGPPKAIRVSREQAQQLFEEQSFSLVKAHELKYDYLLIFKKKSQ